MQKSNKPWVWAKGTCGPVKFTISLQMLFKVVQNVIKCFCKKRINFSLNRPCKFSKSYMEREFFLFRPEQKEYKCVYFI